MLRYFRLLIASTFILALLVPSAWSQSSARIVRISDVEGQVNFDNGHGYDHATINIPVTQGNRLSTAEDGWAEVQFEDGSTLRLAPDSEIVFTELMRSAEGGTLTSVDLNRGEAELNVSYHDDSSFAINVARKEIRVRHSGRFRVSTSNSSPLDLAVWKGEVAVRSPDEDQEASVHTSETFTLDPNDAARYDLETGIQQDDLDQWSGQRDEYLQSYASNTLPSEQAPYQYGVSDLNYYGQYYNLPGYGYCWRPYGVNLGWDPFANGFWTLSPAYGYIWVSAYPWGWMPYRYGQWAFVNGYGWVWQPGNWSEWHHRPSFVHAPPHFRPPETPHGGVLPPKIVASGGGPIKPPVRIGHEPVWQRGGEGDNGIHALRRVPANPPADKHDSPRFSPPQPGNDGAIANHPPANSPPDRRESPRFGSGKEPDTEQPPQAVHGSGFVKPPATRSADTPSVHSSPAPAPTPAPPAPARSYSPPPPPPAPSHTEPSRSISPPSPSHAESPRSSSPPANSSSHSDDGVGRPKR
jgi:hypothetical protein